ncbi:MAG: CDP-alcohol phosphatidyltransferase family protein [Bacteroidia bacterium]|nr:CDP-alcohol phosphatidyltransferase family protein [Bacteroidia bacterium]
MSIKKYIPNTITCGNLLCGCLAIIKIFEGDLMWASYLVIIAAVLDFFDGFAARMLKVSTPIGKDLDSLADMVTFGIVPAMIMFKLIDVSCLLAFMKSKAAGGDASGLWSEYSRQNLVKFAGLLIAIFSALRLAKFNNDTRQSDSFIGVPTPANTIFVIGLPLIFNSLGLNFSDINEVLAKEELFKADGNVTGMAALFLLTSPLVLVGISVVLSLLLVSEIPLLALKFKNFSWKDNKVRFIFLLLSVILIALLKVVAVPLIIVLYILVSIVNNIFFNRQ